MDKFALLAALEDGQYHSGSDLGRRLGVTRAAVFHTISQLRQQGYEIDSLPSRGYRLVHGPDRLQQDRILHLLGNHPWAPLVQVLDTVDSTNNLLKRLAQEGAPQGTVAIADCQTGGRGRMGRQFDSPPGSSIYLSALLRPGCPPDRLMSLTAQAAVAVARAVRTACGAEPEIKWVNDLVLGGRKICGILTEMTLEAESALVNYAVIGVGVNCNRTEFPPELASIAGSLLTQTGRPVDRCALAAAMVEELSRLPGADWLEDYRRRCLNLGKRVQILDPDKVRTATAVDVGPQGELVVQLPDGRVRSIRSGEVSVRGLYGYAE